MPFPYPVRSSLANASANELLVQPIGALVSLSSDGVVLLNQLGIATIFDLATSSIFAAARFIVQEAERVTDAPLLTVPADMLGATVTSTDPTVIADSPVGVLRQMTAAAAARFESTLGITTIREMATAPVYEAARQIFNDAYGMTDAAPDDERPDDLVPVSRRYATERVQYDVVVMDKVLETSGAPGPSTPAGPRAAFTPVANLTDITVVGAIDLSNVVAAAMVARPAVGAVLTYTQSWYPQGLSLGQLLHSLALAPGESTRIAMVDWTRAVRASTTESTSQMESLYDDIGRTRAMSEITSAVAQEAQSGFSGSRSDSTQTQWSTTTGSASAQWDTPGVFGTVKSFLTGGSMGGPSTSSRGSTWSTGSNTTSASGWASSAGTRSLNAEMSQNVSDRTQQAANSVRNRRAVAITESSQKESETLSTRVVTNYNHMHALTVQYFEVVQVYRVVVQLSNVTRCLFLPMKLITFTPDVIARYRDVIAAAGLNPQVRALAISDPDHLAIVCPSAPNGWDHMALDLLKSLLGYDAGVPGDPALYLPLQGLQITQVALSGALYNAGFTTVQVTLSDGTSQTIAVGDVGTYLNSHPAKLPGGGAADAVAQISAVRPSDNASWTGDADAGLWIDFPLGNGQQASSQVLPYLPIKIHVDTNVTSVVLFDFAKTFKMSDLLAHLKQNQLHYSTAIWRAIDAATMTTLLATYTMDGRRLIEVIDPVPVTVTGNYIVLRLRAGEDSADWQAFLKKHDLISPKPVEDLVPLPSAGVFAEAVLGRSNSAEKIDPYRFWNWQDSPIPILPPEINPLTAGGKANDTTPTTGSLQAPVVNIMNPPALPDPTGLGPLYQAIANGNMFRDMSGMAQTAALAQAALQAAQTGATAAGQQSGQAQQVAAKQLNDLLQLMAQVGMAAMGVPAPGLGAKGGGSNATTASLPPNPTNLANKLAVAKDLDNSESGASGGGGGASTSPQPSSPTGPAGPGTPALPPKKKKSTGSTKHQSSVLHGQAYQDQAATAPAAPVNVTLSVDVLHDSVKDFPYNGLVTLDFGYVSAGGSNATAGSAGQVNIAISSGGIGSGQPDAGVPILPVQQYLVRVLSFVPSGAPGFVQQLSNSLGALFGTALDTGQLNTLAQAANDQIAGAALDASVVHGAVVKVGTDGIVNLGMQAQYTSLSTVTLTLNASAGINTSGGVVGSIDFAKLAQALASEAGPEALAVGGLTNAITASLQGSTTLTASELATGTATITIPRYRLSSVTLTPA